MDFGIMFFSSAGQSAAANRYELLIEAAKFADQRGFCCIWTPERHFHEFGGLFPNPSVTSAALAMITDRLQIRAGSLISPLHDVIRIVEEWSVVDNLSRGRVAISFGSGWNVDDFIFFPERYESRHKVMYQQIETIKLLWGGGSIVRENSYGKQVKVNLYPRPVQPDLPIWITSSGNAETFASAGSIGANVLTHLIGQSVDALAEKIQRYRAAREEHGFDAGAGKVSLMLHTFLGADAESVKSLVREPFREYLRSAISLEEKAATAGGVISGGHKIDPHNIPDDVMEELLDITFDRYFHTAALMGTPSDCKQMVWRLKEIGVDEIACLIDFGVAEQSVIESLEHLDTLRAAFSQDAINRATGQALSAFLEEL
ncbi:MAG TPA: LLM class flavin-dependent oxidoreductase [Blastocatellia bacterium]|nr:LLM class flavin-dependent oxidoreductase [Blastocatellia bacterium]